MTVKTAEGGLSGAIHLNRTPQVLEDLGGGYQGVSYVDTDSLNGQHRTSHVAEWPT